MRTFCLPIAVILLLPPTAGAQTKTIAPGQTLVVEGVPAIPASLAEEVRPYTESRSAVFADWHPARREMLIATRFGNTAQIHDVRMPAARGRKSRFFPSPWAARASNRRRAGFSSSRRTWGATSSTSCIATTSPTGT
jgi:hypothetical protein